MIEEVCGSCKGMIKVDNYKHEVRIIEEWRFQHRCEGPQISYYFQSAPVPEPEEYYDDES